MTRTIPLALFLLTIGLLAVVSCRKSDLRTALIEVPDMDDALSVRIVTNAALDEVVGRYGVQHDYEIDMDRKVIVYHESQKLMSKDYHRLIEARIKQVGFTARVLKAGFNPTPIIERDGKKARRWADRFTAYIFVPDMTTHTQANIVTDAIAYARLGREDPRVVVDPGSRTVTARYESLHLARRNIEQAIASVGFTANTLAPNMGRPDAQPYGWTPVKL